MEPLQPLDSLHLRAAQGWCELHSFLEANEELEKITPESRALPSVLEVRWQHRQRPWSRWCPTGPAVGFTMAPAKQVNVEAATINQW